MPDNWNEEPDDFELPTDDLDISPRSVRPNERRKGLIDLEVQVRLLRSQFDDHLEEQKETLGGLRTQIEWILDRWNSWNLQRKVAFGIATILLDRVSIYVFDRLF